MTTPSTLRSPQSALESVHRCQVKLPKRLMLLNRVELLHAAGKIASRIFSSYDDGPDGLFREPPVSEDGFLWWQTPVALEALLAWEQLSGNFSRHSSIEECFHYNNDRDHRIFSPRWGGIENDEKNDDMLWWALAAISSTDPHLLDSAAYVHDHVRRFWAGQEHAGCGGGIRWSADPSHSGWSYLNSVTNGQFLLVSALLAEHDLEQENRWIPSWPRRRKDHSRSNIVDESSNQNIGSFAQTDSAWYTEWAERTYSWMKSTHLISPINSAVYDGIHEPSCNITEPESNYEWSYNIALPLLASAILFKISGKAQWIREHELLKTHLLSHFVNSQGILYEPVCAQYGCNGNDWRVFLAILSRCISQAYQILPDDRLRDVLLQSAASHVEVLSIKHEHLAQEINDLYAKDAFDQISLQAATSHVKVRLLQENIVALESLNAALRVL